MSGDREHLHKILTDLALDKQRFFIGGSGPIALRGLLNAGDLDIGVTTAYWFELERDPDWSLVTPNQMDAKRRCDPPYLEQMVHGLPVHVFFTWRVRHNEVAMDSSYNEIFARYVEFIDGWPCISLKLLLRQKALAQRPKDIAMIGMVANLIATEDR